jgi:hypothetical protein
VYECNPDHSTILGDHRRTILFLKWSSDAFGIRILIVLSDYHSFKSVFLDFFEQFKIRGDLEEISNIRSVSNWISYLHANSWIFGSFLDILINFLNSKRDLDFPNF